MEEKENIIRRKGKGKEMKGAKSFLKKGYRWKNDVRDVCMYTSTFSNTSTPLSLFSTFHTSILNFNLSLPLFLYFTYSQGHKIYSGCGSRTALPWICLEVVIRPTQVILRFFVHNSVIDPSSNPRINPFLWWTTRYKSFSIYIYSIPVHPKGKQKQIRKRTARSQNCK